MKGFSKIKSFLLLPIFCVSSCSKPLETGFIDIEHETKFGGTYIKIPIEEFNSNGFSFGDSLNISFSNGKVYEDIPYYSGYYTRTGETLVVGYPGYPYIDFCENNGEDTYLKSELKEGDKANVILNETSKYLNTEETFSLVYSDNEIDFPSTEIFGNFRPINLGNMKENFIYRSASPCDNQHNRAGTVNSLIESNNVDYIFDLSDGEEEVENFINTTSYDYWKNLALNNKVVPLGMNANYRSDSYKSKVKIIFEKFLESNSNKYLIHCVEGKDRTGFISLLFGILGDANLEELESDYMVTYKNYYNIIKDEYFEKYNAILNLKFYDFTNYLSSSNLNEDVSKENLFEGCKSYLISCGLTLEKINLCINKICK